MKGIDFCASMPENLFSLLLMQKYIKGCQIGLSHPRNAFDNHHRPRITQLQFVHPSHKPLYRRDFEGECIIGNGKFFFLPGSQIDLQSFRFKSNVDFFGIHRIQFDISFSIHPLALENAQPFQLGEDSGNIGFLHAQNFRDFSGIGRFIFQQIDDLEIGFVRECFEELRGLCLHTY